ncbi:hypothetical protein CFE70_002963 [Pyrenophora teres f. teres 0-1]
MRGILRHEIKGLKNALVAKKKQQKKSYPLDLQNNEDEYGGAVFWSPRKLRQAKERKAAEDNERSQLQLQKAEISKSKEQARLSKLQAAQDKRVEREKKKEAREKEKAEKAADRDSKNAIQQAQNSKRKASKSCSESNKRQKHVVTATVVKESSGATPAPTPVTTRSGRNTKVPSKYK